MAHSLPSAKNSTAALEDFRGMLLCSAPWHTLGWLCRALRCFKRETLQGPCFPGMEKPDKCGLDWVWLDLSLEPSFWPSVCSSSPEDRECGHSFKIPKGLTLLHTGRWKTRLHWTVALDPFFRREGEHWSYYRKKPRVEALASSRPFESGISLRSASITKQAKAGVS